jgi:hypothetical protein
MVLLFLRRKKKTKRRIQTLFNLFFFTNMKIATEFEAIKLEEHTVNL